MHASLQNRLQVVPSFNPSGLTRLAENRLRVKLRQEAPSEPWVEAQFVEVSSIDERGRTIVRCRHEPTVFPPGGAKTSMVRCADCNIFTPPCAMEDGVCLDHRETNDWGPSPSAMAIHTIRHYGTKIDPIELLPEDVHSLQREIAGFGKKEAKSQKKNEKPQAIL